VTDRDDRREIRLALNDVYKATFSPPQDLQVGAKAKRLLALFECEEEHRDHDSANALNERAAEIAKDLGLPEVYSYHVIQAFVELFNEDLSFRETTHAHVEELRPGWRQIES
jgi:hypothetical protein